MNHLDEFYYTHHIIIKYIEFYFEGHENDQDAINNFIQEAHYMKRFKNDNVLSIEGIFMRKNVPTIVMPYMHHGDLRTFLKNNPKTDLNKLIDFAVQIAKGKNYCQGQIFIYLTYRYGIPI